MLYRYDIGLRIKVAVFIAMGLSDIIYYFLTLDKNGKCYDMSYSICYLWNLLFTNYKKMVGK
jgi:hypothetical protein